MATFAEDHPIAPLRGRRILEADEVKQELEKRVAWLKHRLEIREIEGREPGAFVRELKAVVLALECYREVFPDDDAEEST